MKVLVPVKRVVDYQLSPRPSVDGRAIDTTGLKMSMNPFDEIAVEEAVRLREGGLASEVVVVSCGLLASQETLRTALAMGADRAILIETAAALQPLAVAKLLKVLALRETPDLIIMGRQAVDDDATQTPQMLAAMLGWPQASFASKLRIEEGMLTVSCEVDQGQDVFELGLPAVVSTDLRLNTPRYTSLPNVMKARRTIIETLAAESLGVDLVARLQTLQVRELVVERSCEMISDVAELAARLRKALGSKK